jgi:hypothetical protein
MRRGRTRGIDAIVSGAVSRAPAVRIADVPKGKERGVTGDIRDLGGVLRKELFG